MYELQTNNNGVAEQFVEEGNVFAAMAALVGEHKRVLDLGCSSEYFTKLLARRHCEVTRVRIMDGEKVRLSELLAGALSFDVIVCGDILGRLREPLRLLEEAWGFLADGGYVIASIPNIAHGAVRLSLLAGSFDYQDSGLLDSAHIRFFTKKSIDELFLGAGFRIGHMERMRQPVFEESGLVPRLDAHDYRGDAVEEMLEDPDVDTKQFVLQAFPLTGDERVRFLSKNVLSARAELHEVSRRTKRRERELETARERNLQLERQLEEVRGHLSRADEEMRHAQISHAAVERELRDAPGTFALLEEARVSCDRLSREREALLGRLKEVEHEARLVELDRERLAERAKHLEAELERLRPFVERAQRAEVVGARLEGREAFFERRFEEMSLNLERARAARENAERALASLVGEHDGFLIKYDGLLTERDVLGSRLAQALGKMEALSVADRDRLQSLDRLLVERGVLTRERDELRSRLTRALGKAEAMSLAERNVLARERNELQSHLAQALEKAALLERLFADQVTFATVEAQAESRRLAFMIDIVQSSRFWTFKRFLFELLGYRIEVA